MKRTGKPHKRSSAGTRASMSSPAIGELMRCTASIALNPASDTPWYLRGNSPAHNPYRRGLRPIQQGSLHGYEGKYPHWQIGFCSIWRNTLPRIEGYRTDMHATLQICAWVKPIFPESTRYDGYMHTIALPAFLWWYKTGGKASGK